jgi:hypothetical protein
MQHILIREENHRYAIQKVDDLLQNRSCIIAATEVIQGQVLFGYDIWFHTLFYNLQRKNPRDWTPKDIERQISELPINLLKTLKQLSPESHVYFRSASDFLENSLKGAKPTEADLNIVIDDRGCKETFGEKLIDDIGDIWMAWGRWVTEYLRETSSEPEGRYLFRTNLQQHILIAKEMLNDMSVHNLH